MTAQNPSSPPADAGQDPAAPATSPALDSAANGRKSPTPPRLLSPDLETRHAELSDAFLRAKAEAENMRRRAEEEVAKARKYAVESFAESMLPVKDSLEAAISIPAATTEQMLEGVHATLRQLSAALERNKVLEINPARRRQVRPPPAPGHLRRAGRAGAEHRGRACCRRAT